jgi:hypothetical protein
MKKDLKIDELVKITISSRKTSKQWRIDEVLERLGYTNHLSLNMHVKKRGLREELMKKNAVS